MFPPHFLSTFFDGRFSFYISPFPCCSSFNFSNFHISSLPPLFILKRTIFFFKPTRNRFHSFWTVNNQEKKRTKPKKIYNLQLCNRKFCVFSLIPLPFSLYNILVSNYIFIAKRDLECAKAILL